MAKLNYEKFSQLKRPTRQYILENTFEEIITGQVKEHSLQTIIKQDRVLSVGCRMLSSSTITVNNKQFTGEAIADVFINSVQQKGVSFYPLTGNWKDTNIEKLILFTKQNNKGKYVPYVAFDIIDIIETSTQPDYFNN